MWGGAVITLYSPVWASTPGNPLPQAPKYRPDQDRRNRSPSHPLPFEQAPSPAPFPHRESVPQLESAGLVASASAGRNKGGGGGSRALRHGPAPPPSRGGHVAGSALKPGASGLAAAAEPAPLSLVGPRRGWGRGGPRFVWSLGSCHPAPTLCTIEPSPPHALARRGAAPQQGPMPAFPQPARGLQGPQLPRKLGRTEHPNHPHHARD